MARPILRHFHPRFRHGQSSSYCVRLKEALQFCKLLFYKKAYPLYDS